MQPDNKEGSTAGPRRPLVLLVEDNPIDVFVIKDVLREYGLDLDLRIADNGQNALGFLDDLVTAGEACPALVLLDLNLPKVSGLDVLKRLRSETQCRNVPVVVVSSSIADSDRSSAQAFGVHAYFQKPSDLKAYGTLAQIIREALHLD